MEDAKRGGTIWKWMKVTWDNIAHPKGRKENSMDAQKSSITKFGERKKNGCGRCLIVLRLLLVKGNWELAKQEKAV